MNYLVQWKASVLETALFVPSRPKNLSHDGFLAGCVNVIRSLSLFVGPIK
jgi:hypothetical protein